jgi:predicted GIY-YIG superfamily endonuclease
MEHATITFSNELQTMEKALKCEDAMKWEIAIQEKYNYLVVNNI